MPLSDDIATRSDAEISAALHRILVRQMALDPIYAGIAGSLEDLRAAATAAVPELAVESVEQRDEPAILRALLHDIAGRADVSHLVDGCFDRSRGTILREVTPSLVLAALALAAWSELECSFTDPARRAGLQVRVKTGGRPGHAVERFLDSVRA